MKLPALALLAALLAACSASGGPASSPTPRPSPRIVYAAIGASETVGIGTDDPARQSFPQQLLQHLGLAVMYDFGIPSETTEKALTDELPQALAVHPNLVTVWLNVDDLVAGVSVADYAAHLDELVKALRATGARVLVANTPQVDKLPAYAACRPNPPPGPQCPLGSTVLPPVDQVDQDVLAYNAAIAGVTAREGAMLVDLYAAGEVPVLHPEYVGMDGFHPSAAGAAAIATTFAAALGLAPTPSPGG